MQRSEIGSEFWKYPERKRDLTTPSFTENLHTRWFISGRTALDHIIKDIKYRIGNFSVAMPSYFCYSMLEPFFSNGIDQIEFYDVVYRDGKLTADFNTDANIVFIIDYFGVTSPETRKMINNCRTDNRIVILDTTQSVFCATDNIMRADYSFCSYRKWLFTNAAMSYAKSGFAIDYEEKLDTLYTDLRLLAADKKSNYINGKSDSKDYLELFQLADETLRDDYIGYTPRAHEIDILHNIDTESIANARRENASLIVSELSDTVRGCFQFALPNISDNDAPLFVPIIIDNETRRALRLFLIEKRIYCPIHWDITNYHASLTSKQINIYNCELSLICDQRYDIASINREISEIKKFFAGNFFRK